MIPPSCLRDLQFVLNGATNEPSIIWTRNGSIIFLNGKTPLYYVDCLLGKMEDSDEESEVNETYFDEWDWFTIESVDNEKRRVQIGGFPELKDAIAFTEEYMDVNQTFQTKFPDFYNVQLLKNTHLLISDCHNNVVEDYQYKIPQQT